MNVNKFECEVSCYGLYNVMKRMRSSRKQFLRKQHRKYLVYKNNRLASKSRRGCFTMCIQRERERSISFLVKQRDKWVGYLSQNSPFTSQKEQQFINDDLAVVRGLIKHLSDKENE